MKFISICSGIEAASVAFTPLGWAASAFSEIEPFPCRVLAEHYPQVPNFGDMTNFREWPEEIFAEADAIVGGPPCQAFSVAGLRNSLGDTRGNLTLLYSEIINHADEVRLEHGKPPVIVLYENVPGILNTKDNAFGCFLAGLAGESVPLVAPGGKWPNAGVVVGPQRSLAWRVLDAQYFGLAQRRKRVFVVASARDGFDPARVLLVEEGVRRDTPPSREAGQEVTGTVGARTGCSIGAQDAALGHLRPCVTFDRQSSGEYGEADIASTMSARDYKSASDLITYALAGNTIGREPQNGGNGTGYDESGVSYTLTKTDVHAVCFPINTQIATRHEAMGERTGMGIGANGDPAYTIQAAHSHAVAFGVGEKPDLAPCLRGQASRADKHESTTYAVQAMQVRRLTPVECEALQGFPKNYTNIPKASNSARYKALGNSWAVPVVRWIGWRIWAELFT